MGNICKSIKKNNNSEIITNDISCKCEDKRIIPNTLLHPEKTFWTTVPPYKMKINNTIYTLEGYSQAARHTGFYIKELNMFLDCGVPHNKCPEYIFCTHGHLDHSGSLAQALIDTGSKVSPTIVVPQPTYEQFKNYIHHTFVLTKNNPNPKIHNKYKLIGAKADTTFMMTIKNMKWNIEVIKCNHTVPTSGYGFIEKRNKLKPEFMNLPQEELNKIRKSGIEISEEKEYPLFCFLGDTDHKVFENDKLFKYNIIIVECTFFEYEENKIMSVKKPNLSEMEIHASKNRHIYWNNLKPIIINHPNILFILTHFSARYTCKEIHDFFTSQNIKNIHVWI
jgi:ribonuclease Z